MISVAEAQRKILAAVSHSSETVIPVSRGYGNALAQTVFAPLDLPPFDQSAMDGYALRMKDVVSGRALAVIGESAAGKPFLKRIPKNSCVRIFTGAQIPPGADTVVMQEKVIVRGNSIFAGDSGLLRGKNIRKRGSEIWKGRTGLRKGDLLTPAAIGFLSSMGLKSVMTYRKPRISIIITGNELQKPGSRLSRGTVYESNGPALRAALKSFGFDRVGMFPAQDEKKKTRMVFNKAIRNSDFVLFTGGISVGKYDFVGTVLQEAGVKTIFYKVKQKPGKPLYFGALNNKYIFGLPGNPASVLTCFFEYVLPALRKFTNTKPYLLPALRIPVSSSIKRKAGMTQFLKATTDLNSATPLSGQESYILSSFAQSNCFIVLFEETGVVKAGAMVDVHLLSHL